ncbi:MAG TPA: flagellar hook-associated protein FlgL [Burkholderiaceae bacterium]|nr:flagellar hook-associated protein FlgL [Burkholderiaceae bacterium]
MVRVSTSSLFANGTASIMQAETAMLATQQQLSSGKKINSPSDDPVGAAQVASINSTLSQFDQYKSNQDRAEYLLNLGESTLGQMGDAAQQVKQKLIAAGNGTYSNADRQSLAADLQGLLAQMVGLANSSDGSGGYLFGGSSEGKPPFSQTGNTVAYNGDDTQMRLEVSGNRYQPVKQAGDDLFLKVRPGNGTFTTNAGASNTGSGIVDAGSVSDPTQLTGSAYTIAFSVSGGATTYQVVRASDNAVVASGNYTAPASITFDGEQVNIRGTPADGDTFQVAPAGYQSIFDTIGSAIQLLSKGVSTAADQAQFQTTLTGLNASVDQMIGQLSLKQASYGSSLSELSGYQQLNGDRQLQYQTRLSSVQDLDVAQATSQLSQQQLTYQAALQSYSSISKLSLFNYLTTA